MGTCLILRRKGSFKAWISVQANPGATITAASTKKTYTAVADSTTGIATILVKKKGDYAITTDCGASYDAIGNISLVSALKNKQTYKAQKVKLNAGYSSFEVRSDYESNSLLAYWDGTKPDAYCTNYYVEEVTSGGYVGKYVGVGESYDVDTTTTVTGYKETVDGGTEKEYRLTSYLCINGIDYYGAPMTASGTAVTYEAYTENVTATKTLTVPAGCHSITAFVVGGGGGGGNGGWWSPNYSSSSWSCYTSGGGGGGGGYQTSATTACIPGQTISCVVGAGGAGGTGSAKRITTYLPQRCGGYSNGGSAGETSSVTVNGVTTSASGGSGGGNGYVKMDNTAHYYSNIWSGSGGNGYKSGSAGAAVPDEKSETGNASAGGSSTNGYSGGGGGASSYYEANANKMIATYYNRGGAGGSGGGGAGWGYVYTSKDLSSSAGMSSVVSGTANSGGGGGGHANFLNTGGAGGSGVIKITYNY